MKMILYNNYSESIKVNKSLVKIIELEGYLREQTSLINPSMIIELNPNNLDNTIVDDNGIYVMYNGVKITWNNFIYNYVLAANYAYIEEFNRYYYISDVVSYRNDLWRIPLDVDVLMSYKDKILGLDAFVLRNEFNYNDFIKDDLVSFYYDKEISETIFEKGTLVNTTFKLDVGIENRYNVVVTCQAQNGDIGLEHIDTPSGTNLPSIQQSDFNDQYSECSYVGDTVDLSSITLSCLRDDNLATFIKSIMFYPFDVEHGSTAQQVYLGDQAIEKGGGTPLQMYFAKYKVSNYIITEDFTITSPESFLDYEPYTQYELYVPYYGWIKLSAEQILGNRIIIYYTIQLSTGSGNVYVYDVTNNKMLFTSPCQMGMQLGVTSTNNTEIDNAQKANTLNLAVGAIASAGSIGLGLITGNPIAIMGGGMGLYKSIVTAVNNASQMYDKAQVSYGTANAGMYNSQRAILRKTVMKPKNYNDDYAKLYGKPLNQYIKLNELSGYTLISDIHIEDIGNITKTEFDQLHTLLTSGIIL